MNTSMTPDQARQNLMQYLLARRSGDTNYSFSLEALETLLSMYDAFDLLINGGCILCKINQPFDQSGNYHDMGGHAKQLCTRTRR